MREKGGLVEVAEGLCRVLVEEALQRLGGKGVVAVLVVVVVVVERVDLGGATMGPLGSVVAVAGRLAEENPRAYSSECARGLHSAGTDP